MNHQFAFRGQIAPPPRSSLFGAVLLICLIVLFGLYQTYPFPQAIQIWVSRAMILLLPLSIASRSIYTIHFNVFLVCYYLMSFFPRFPVYPFNHLTLLLLYAYVVMLIPALRGSVGWLRAGKFDAKIWAFILTFIIVPSAALIAWVELLHPDFAHYSQIAPQLPAWLAIAYGIASSTFNAALEETTWRGVMLESLDSAFGPGTCALIIQAISFAAAHYRNGFPNGIVGSAMVFVFGMMLGILRRKSKGMLACWLAHAAVDSTIYCLVFYFLRESSKR